MLPQVAAAADGAAATPSPSWGRVIVDAIPFLFLLAFWLYFVAKVKPVRHQKLVERNFQHMDRVEALLERIATAVEKRQG